MREERRIFNNQEMGIGKIASSLTYCIAIINTSKQLMMDGWEKVVLIVLN